MGRVSIVHTPDRQIFSVLPSIANRVSTQLYITDSPEKNGPGLNSVYVTVATSNGGVGQAVNTDKLKQFFKLVFQPILRNIIHEPHLPDILALL